MKKVILFITGLLLLGALSCSDDNLDLMDPNRESSDTYWEKEEDYYKGLNASYSVWRIPNYFSRFYHVLMLLRSDEGYSDGPAPEWHAYGNFQLTPYNTDATEGIRAPWIAIYRQLFYVNQVIDNMSSRGYGIFLANAKNDLEKAAKQKEADELLGQVYFIRGVSFWYLAGTYGKGPRQVSSTKDGEIIEQEEIYKQALADFEKAEELLKERKSWSGEDLGRVTLGAALGMQARVHMQLAGYYKRPWVKNQTAANTQWAEAKRTIEEVLKLNYSLVPNWVDNFTMANENNSESIFEIQFKEGLINGKEVGAHRPKFFGLQLQSGEGAWFDGSAREWLLDEFDKELDKDGNSDLRKYYTLFYENLNDNMKYYGKTYAEWKAGGDLAKKCYWRKYSSVDSDPSKKEDYSSGINFRMLRLADVYLMYAEVLNELNGDRNLAVEYINKVRRRVNMKDLDPSMYADYNALLDQIKHERLMELCGECTRWLDLDRWGDIHTQEGVNQLALRDPDFNTYTVGINHLFIIPNRELSLYPGLKQNPGY
ncbi:MAG: RagB/SusD family nutrient uptake outer membrane protein [Breznakibacter sp.]